jgi:hypothetical protein
MTVHIHPESSPSFSAESIAKALGNGKEQRTRTGWLTCCPVHGDKNPSLSINDSTDRYGRPDLSVKCFAGCDYKAVKDELRARGLLPEWRPPRSAVSAGAKDNKNWAASIWNKSRHDQTAAETIQKAFAFRSIQLEPIPPNIRLNSYKEGQLSIACVMQSPLDENPPAKPQCVHLTLLDNEGKKKKRSNEVPSTKYHGPKTGLAVMLPGKDNSRLVIGEGLETTLSAMQAMGFSGMVCGDAGNMAGMAKLREQFQEIFILVDSDSSHAGQNAALKAAESIGKANPKAAVWLVAPDDSCFTDAPAKLDFNDLLKQDPSGELIKARFERKKRLDEIDWRPKEKEKEAAPETGGEYPPETLKKLHEMNSKYAACLLSGKFRISKEVYNTVRGFHTVDFIEINSFKNFFANRHCMIYTAKGGMQKAKLIDVWMSWEGRRSYESVMFDPTGKAGDETFNLFRGFAVQPKKGSWGKMKSHIYNVLCSGNEKYFWYLMAWMARIIQDPGGDRPGVAVVLRGGKGVGKGMFANAFGKLFGESYVPVSTAKGLTGDFNAHLAKALLVFADEAVWAGDKQAEGRLKAMITEYSIDFEPKGFDKIPMKNHINLIMASNEDWVVPATEDERRFFVLDLQRHDFMTPEYFEAISEEMENGGYEAMMQELSELDYSTIKLRQAPKTEGLVRQVEESLKPAMEFWRKVLERGYLLSEPDTGGPKQTEFSAEQQTEWPEMAWKHEITYEFETVFQRNRRGYHVGGGKLWKELRKFWEPEFIMPRNSEGKQVRAVVIPSLEELRRAFTAHTGIGFDDQENNEAEPVSTSCVNNLCQKNTAETTGYQSDTTDIGHTGGKNTADKKTCVNYLCGRDCEKETA